MWSRHFIGLPAIAACAVALVSCAKPNPLANSPLAVVVPADALACQVLEQPVPCTDIPTYLAKTLEISTARPIILSDRNNARTDDAITKLVDELGKAGYTSVMVVGYGTERLQGTQRL